ncbi:hypothetical protein KUTeg_021685 [Tegillarca granosa]|uniref:Abnormal spindle-like microcephaly-associated protein ASH domain-containing protein n=1 Tax=Tegillarca granosa TaxID=220873 RepID=A0ABQ9E6X7_TEGGR|nr:hypothetical protein KUTeg_021685 [Tegillarca granosa]
MACSEQSSSQNQVIEDMWNALDSQNIPISTSTPSSVRRKSRKSWFETNPKGKKFEIAVEKNPTLKPSRKSDVEDEVLLLTHFTNPPKVGFNKLKPSGKKTRTLIIKNPHEYDQQVKIEKFPHKKYFSTDLYEFVVEGNSSYRMVITWTPAEEGNFREMILFLVDGVYRVQAFVFGTVEASPQKKKPVCIFIRGGPKES